MLFILIFIIVKNLVFSVNLFKWDSYKISFLDIRMWKRKSFCSQFKIVICKNIYIDDPVCI